MIQSKHLTLIAIAALALSACQNSAGDPEPPLLDMVSVPGGVFQRILLMSDDQTEVDAFHISPCEITQAQYMEVTGKPNPSWNVAPNVAANDTDRPVDTVSWFDALVFCNLLSALEGRTPVYSILGSTDPSDWGAVPTGEAPPHYADWRAVVADWDADGYRLPTEAEWMWAAMGATEGGGTWDSGIFLDGCRKYYAGDETPTYLPDNALGDYAWYEATSGLLGSGNPDYGTHAVGTKLPNELGLCDMSGNVSEWCWDICAAYPDNYLVNPTGAETGDYFVFRGGCWMSPDTYLMVGNRSQQQLACNRYTNIGFRVVRRP